MSAFAFFGGKFENNLSRSNIFGQFLKPKAWQIQRNLKVKQFFPIPENPLTIKVGQRKLGGYVKAVYMSNCCFLTHLKKFVFGKK